MIKLTQTVQKGGCAAKVAATELRQILALVRFPPPGQRVLVDGRHFDDAAIYKVNDDLALVQTLDFFTPIVDDPQMFGKIAATNALSDVYAMGGEPKTAMAILAFPLATLPHSVIAEVLQGACDIMSECGVSFVGGHSIDDDTLKFGLSVTGEVHPAHVWTNAGAKVGDQLILTKPLGTGTVTAGLKRQEISENEAFDVLNSMMKPNRILSLLNDHEMAAIHAATDITGFGLMGHSMQMAKASQVSFKIHFHNIPVFDMAWKALEKGFLTKAHRTNAEYTHELCTIKRINELNKKILFDPQTSGGLLLSVGKNMAEQVLKKIQNKFPEAKVIGSVELSDAAYVNVE